MPADTGWTLWSSSKKGSANPLWVNHRDQSLNDQSGSCVEIGKLGLQKVNVLIWSNNGDKHGLTLL